jgi:hypothetical protein
MRQGGMGGAVREVDVSGCRQRTADVAVPLGSSTETMRGEGRGVNPITAVTYVTSLQLSHGPRPARPRASCPFVRPPRSSEPDALISNASSSPLRCFPRALPALKSYRLTPLYPSLYDPAPIGHPSSISSWIKPWSLLAAQYIAQGQEFVKSEHAQQNFDWKLSH